MIDDPGLGSSSRALLDAARPGMSPDPAAADRMRAGIAATVAGTASGTAGVKLALTTKLGLVSLVAVVAIGAMLFATRRGPKTFLAPGAIITAEPIVTPLTPPVVRVAQPSAPAAVTVPEQEMPEIAIVRRPATTAKLDPTVTPAITPSPKAHTPLAREVELVDRAMASLRKGDARAALAAVHDYEIETAGTGQLAEDAAAIQVEAMCALHDPAATTKLAAFDELYPNSAQRSRLGDACYAKH